ncbi:peroxisome assembly protein (Peroxin-2) [Dimargaris xerosporica]|nr:peroxisome assembly protein (Peroxin-2) [Dimargaris xerosporica]
MPSTGPGAEVPSPFITAAAEAIAQGAASVRAKPSPWDRASRDLASSTARWERQLGTQRRPVPASGWASWLQFLISPNRDHTGERVSRVNQLDADLLDADLTDSLLDSWRKAMERFTTDYKHWLEPEITAVLHAAVYWFTVAGPSNATYGAQLQNLRYRNEFAHHRLPLRSSHAPLSRWQMAGYGVLLVGGQYGWTRLNRWITVAGWSEFDDLTWQKKAWRLVQLADKWYHTAALLNFLIFLVRGRYKSLITRVLGMRLVYARPQMQHQVSFEFLNRQMVWYAFTEFLMFILPLINLRRVKRAVTRSGQAVASRLGLSSAPNDQIYHRAQAVPATVCLICRYGGPGHQSAEGPLMASLHAETASDANAEPTLPTVTQQSHRVCVPYVTNCGHLYCYVCITTQLALDANDYRCLRCGTKVESTRPLEAEDVAPQALV